MAPSQFVMMAQGQSRVEEVQAARMGPTPPALMAVSLKNLRDALAKVMTKMTVI